MRATVPAKLIPSKGTATRIAVKGDAALKAASPVLAVWVLARASAMNHATTEGPNV